MNSGSEVAWPGGKRFAFTIFDDPDSQTIEAARGVYSFLRDLGFRTTKGVWPSAPVRTPSDHGLTCGDRAYRDWCIELQRSGFEIGYHNATSHTSTRDETERGLREFSAMFGAPPTTMAQHYFCEENMYWGEYRLSGLTRAAYRLATSFQQRPPSHGHKPGHRLYWADLCKENIRYLRNFVYRDINTLRACPFFPYYDPARPFVNYWYASSEGSNAASFVETMAEANQDLLEEQRGLCIMYVHFGHGFHDGSLNPRFRTLMERLAKKDAWFAPAGVILDFLRERNSGHILTDSERGQIERRWLRQKLLHGTS